jgi:hypothetical protein
MAQTHGKPQETTGMQPNRAGAYCLQIGTFRQPDPGA